jgi:hypothetical protein
VVASLSPDGETVVASSGGRRGEDTYALTYVWRTTMMLAFSAVNMFAEKVRKETDHGKY